MRKLTAFLFVAIAFGLFGCKGPEGPTGPAGNNGTNGNNGTSAFWQIEGFKDSLQCGKCHTADYDTTYRMATRVLQYETSRHLVGGTYTETRTACAGCHTNEGFLERAQKGFASEAYIPGVASGPMVTGTYTNTSAVGCFTCHSPHKRGDFTVRDAGAVTINTLVVGVAAKTWNSTASSNLCVKCHQPRMTSTPFTSSPASWQPDPTKTATTDTAKIYTTRWNNHVSGEVAQTLLGFGGFEFQGYTFGNSYHSTLVGTKAIGCEDCHMATPVGNEYGGHTFKVGFTSEGSTSTTYNFVGCNVSGCHSGGTISATSAKWAGVRNEIKAKVAKLANYCLDTTKTKKWSLPKSGKAVPWVSFTISGTDTSWSVANASTSSPLVIVPAYKAGVLWNLQQVLEEYSFGIHNTAYVRALLDASITEMEKP